MAEVNKRNAEYWQRRFEQILISNEELAVEYEKELAKIYEQVKLDVQKELEAFYTRYSTETGLDLAEVKRRLDPKQLKRFKTQQKIYLAKVEELIEQGANLENYSKTLQKLVARAYVTKLQEIQNNLNSLITILAGQQEVNMAKVLNASYLQGYFKTTFELQKGLGFGMSFTQPSNETVLKVLKTPWNEGNYSTHIWKNKAKLTNWLNKDLPRHFAAGSGVKEMSTELAEKLGTSYNNAVRLVRTEVNYISNQSTMDSYKNSGVVKKYQILATLDSRTSDICRDMDGEIFKVSESQVAVNTPPFHVRCRTTTVPYFEDDEDDLERIAVGSNGQVYYVPGNITYPEWEKKYRK